ncbi:MAG TPA: AAA family ATPase [Flavilitoribacter sp.]|nr:AAA family ATPase [Flavilitoribacter sp.]HMQ90132.1 AAA family ATPase [Flavilitoribacter sp.]
MRIESLTIENFKVFKNTSIKDLPKMAVFLGPNGSGKSTFFDVFGFLSDILQTNVNIAINRRGGFQEVISRNTPTTEKIKFEIKFRNPQPDEEHTPLVTYSLELGYESGKAYIDKEVLKYRRGQYGRPWHFLDFSKGEGFAITNEEEYGKEGITEKRDYQKVASPDVMAIKGLGQFEKFKIITSFRVLLERWYVSNFKIEYGRNLSETGISEHLSVTGHNLAQVTKYMFDYHRDLFDKVLEKLPKRIPGINKVEAKETEDGMILLRFQDESFKNPFLSKFVSDGTIKMFAYLILLHDPVPHPLLCIEEPENFLHPDLLLQLCEEIREYSEKGGQVLVSTHSPDFVNGVHLEELFFLQKSEGFTLIKAAKDDPIVKELSSDNDLGWLWRNHYIKGANL